MRKFMGQVAVLASRGVDVIVYYGSEGPIKHGYG